jgi:hypothetical protein
MIKFIKCILIISICLVFADNIYAACGGSGLNRTAASASLTDVRDCVTAAITGATITVPLGTATWSSAISIPANKDLAIIGSGIGNTNITCSSGTCFTIAQSGESSASRISGFTFNNGNIDLYGLQGNKTFRIDHNRFNASSLTELYVAGYADRIHPTGLIDNNQFVNIRIIVAGTRATLSDGTYQHTIWSQNTALGDFDDVVYIESNSFSATSGHQNAVDANYGGRYVFRFNTLSGTTYVEAHSVQGANRATQRWEVYGNSFSKSQSDWYPMTYIRGGSGVIFNNTATSNYTNDLTFNNVRSCRDPGDGVGKCDGASNWDQNTGGQNGWACRDQIGRMGDTTQLTPGGAYAQNLIPAYLWNNIKGTSTQVSVNISAGEDCPGGDYNSTHIQANRDYYNYTASFNGTSGVGTGSLASRPSTCTTGVAYWATDQGNWNHSGSGGQGVLYKCTATNTWTLYYTPYTYPHPLAGGSGVKPSQPQDLHIVN